MGLGWTGVTRIEYGFDSSLSRLTEFRDKGSYQEQTLFLGNVTIRQKWVQGVKVLTERRSEFGGGSWVRRDHGVIVGNAGYEWNLKDHLGSSTMVLGENKQPVAGGVQKPQAERHSFDAWGARRDPGNWAAAKQEPVGSATGDGLSAAAAQSQNVVATVGRSSSQPSGYTGHQMLDDVGLIHMNGRLYDPFLGRFCAADPYVQSPKNTQNYNRYTYVLNNPLSLVDPSGHFFGLIFGAIAAVATWIAGAVGAIFVAIGVILHAIGSLIIAAGKLLWAAVKFTFTAVKASAAWMKTVGTKLITSIKAGVGPAFKWMATNQITAGAATNAAWSGIQTALHGGSASDIWKSVARGAVIGAVSAVIGMGMHKMGTALGSIAQGGNSATGTLVHAAAHGVSGGAMTAANGGSFKDGFIGGAIGFGVGLPFGGAGGMITGNDLGSIAARTSIAALGGGIASRLSGGSFGDGAYSAAFFHLFNAERDALKELAKPGATLGSAYAELIDLEEGVADVKQGAVDTAVILAETGVTAATAVSGAGTVVKAPGFFSRMWAGARARFFAKQAAKTTTGAADNLADAARAALGKGPDAIPGAPLTELQRTALLQNQADTLANIARAQGNSALSPSQQERMIRLGQERLQAIQDVLKSGVSAQKN